jgi:flavorubredoxin
MGKSKSALIDTAAPRGWQALRRQLALVLDGRSLDFLFPTHPEMPHMGNLGPLMEAYPEATLVGDTRNYHLFFPELEPRTRRMAAGEELDLGGRRLRLVAPVIYDLPNTLWAYDPEAEILFVSDAYPFCHDHLQGECAMMSTELSHPYRATDTDRVLSGALGWTRFVDADYTIGNLQEFLRSHPARLIAPAHGGVIQAPDEVTEVFKEGLRNVRCG